MKIYRFLLLSISSFRSQKVSGNEITDIVGATERLVALGDRHYREVLVQHRVLVRRELAHYGGHEVETTGDGFFATFDTPASAVRCACAIREAVKELGIE